MKKHIASATDYLKNNRMIFGIIVAALLLTIGVVVYDQSNQSALQRQHQEADSKLASQTEQNKKAIDTRKAKEASEKKAAEEAAAKKAAEEKAAAEAAAKKQAEEAAAAVAAQAVQQQATASSISLSAGTPVPKEGTSYYKIPVSWTSGFNSEKGFKLVWNTTGSPTYPESNPEYHEGGTSGSGYIKVTPGTYYIRVCQYLGDGTCGAYSNQVVVNL